MPRNLPGPNARAPMGRAPSLTPEVQTNILRAVAAGGRVYEAAALAGVPKATFTDWCRKGRAGLAPYAALVDALDAARAGHSATLISSVLEGAKDDWRAAAYLLDRQEAQKAAQLAREKARAEIALTHAKLALLAPPAKGQRPEPAEVDALFEDEFGFAGAKQLPEPAHDPRAEDRAADMGREALPVPAGVGPRAE